MRSDYGTMLLNQIEETDICTSEAKLVFAMGATLSKDGNQWCCLLGENLQVGHAEFSTSPLWAVRNMATYIATGKEVNKQEVKE